MKDEQKIAVSGFVFWKSLLSCFTDRFWKMCHLQKLRARDGSFCNHCHRFSSKHYRRSNFDQTIMDRKQLLSKGSRFVKTSVVSSQTSSSKFANVINLVKRVYSTCQSYMINLRQTQVGDRRPRIFGASVKIFQLTLA